jgi:hypothetical protein
MKSARSPLKKGTGSEFMADQASEKRPWRDTCTILQQVARRGVERRRTFLIWGTSDFEYRDLTIRLSVSASHGEENLLPEKLRGARDDTAQRVRPGCGAETVTSA